jgi:hypothetical protein
MSHFYGTLQGQRGEATRCGSKASGITTVAASWKGAVEVSVFVDEQGRDCFSVAQRTWRGAGVSHVIAEGVIGEVSP